MSQRLNGNGQVVEDATLVDKLPAKAMNLARRCNQLAIEIENGRLRLEVVVVNGRWLLFVEGGDRFEDLGSK